MDDKVVLQAEECNQLLAVLKMRFEKNAHRHYNIRWQSVQSKLNLQPTKLWSLFEMERTGGEPDVVGFDENLDQYIFYDCVAETPKGRRSICYDREALESRKEYKPATSAMDMATAMGVEILSEDQYRMLQTLGAFDLKTSSWVKTPVEIRNLGGALFCDRRYNQVFLYHNGTESYYGVRGFRACLYV